MKRRLDGDPAVPSEVQVLDDPRPKSTAAVHGSGGDLRSSSSSSASPPAARQRSRPPVKKPKKEPVLWLDAAFESLKEKFVDTWSTAPPPREDEPHEAFHTSVEWSEQSVEQIKTPSYTASLLVDADDVSDEGSLRRAFLECNNATLARKRKLEVKERDVIEEEFRGVACAKRAEFASWLDNSVIDLLVTRGVPHDRIVRCRWVLTFKKLDSDEAAAVAKKDDDLGS